MEYEPIDTEKVKSEISKANRARYIKGMGDYFSLRKIIFGTTNKSYENENDGVISLNLTTSGDKYYHFILPKSFDISTIDPNSCTLNEFLTKIKTINSPSFNWGCEWFDSIKDVINEVFSLLFMLKIDFNPDENYIETYIPFPLVTTSVNEWNSMIEYIKLLLITNNPDIIDQTLDKFQTSENSGRFAFPVLTYTYNEENEKYEEAFELTVYITV